MSRPKPTVIIEHANKQSYKTDQVLEAEGIWAVYYNNQPINLRTTSMIGGLTSPKYRKVAFSNPGHAHNLSKKLNKQFKTDKFQVVLLNSGTVVSEV